MLIISSRLSPLSSDHLMTVRTADVFVSTLSPYHLTVILEYLSNCFTIAEVVMVLTYWIIVKCHCHHCGKK